MKYTTDILSEIQTWCHYADVAPTYETIEYGALYNWYAATDVRDITSVGWHIPTITEFKTLADYIGAGGNYVTNTIGYKLKETGIIYWASPNINATNEVNFNARGVGGRSSLNGSFSGLKYNVGYICSTTFSGGFNHVALLQSSNEIFYTRSDVGLAKNAGYSIRPIKDSTTLSDGETGTYTGNDGKIYRTICIGTQEWIADNLAETKYRDGSDIPIVTDNATWAALTDGAMCYYNNDSSNA